MKTGQRVDWVTGAEHAPQNLALACHETVAINDDKKRVSGRKVSVALREEQSDGEAEKLGERERHSAQVLQRELRQRVCVSSYIYNY